MVKLPVFDLAYHLEKAREWVYLYEVNHNITPRPGVLEFELFALLAVLNYAQEGANPVGYEPEHIRQVALNWIRELFDTDSEKRCDNSGAVIDQDEIGKPER